MERMRGVDAGYLYMETPTMHMHTVKVAILERPGAHEAIAHELGQIVQSAEHLARLIGDLLDLSRAEIGALEIFPELLDPRALLADLFTSLAGRRAPDGPVRWLLDLPAQLPPLAADPVRVRQIVLNLLANAEKFTAAGQITLGARAEDGRLRLWVADSGPGLSQEQQAMLFQPFQRLGRENSTIPGTGIGLVLCRELAELMGGEMGFSSAPDIGSRFWIDLPCVAAPDEFEPPAPARPAEEERQVQPKVLCVEDHPACLKVLQEGLRDMADVRGAGSVGKALALLADITPSLLLLDLDLPDGDGLDVLDFVRSSPRLAMMPVLVVSAAVDEKVLAEARRRGADACLSKPVDLKQVRRMALSLLGQEA